MDCRGDENVCTCVDPVTNTDGATLRDEDEDNVTRHSAGRTSWCYPFHYAFLYCTERWNVTTVIHIRQRVVVFGIAVGIVVVVVIVIVVVIVRKQSQGDSTHLIYVSLLFSVSVSVSLGEA